MNGNETTNTPTWRSLLAEEAGVDMDRVREQLRLSEADAPQPLLIKVLSGIGAWFTSFFMLLFFSVFGVYESSLACAVLGMGVFGRAVYLSQLRENVFVDQLSLAALLSGNSLILGAVGQALDGWHSSVGVATATQFVIAVVTGVFYRGVVGRFICMSAVPFFAVVRAVFENSPLAMQIIMALLALIVGAIFGWKKRGSRWDIVGHVAIFALLGTVLFAELLHEFWWFRTMRVQLQPNCIPIALAFLWLTFQYGGGTSATRKPWMWLTLGAIALLAAFTTPGLLVALLVLLIAHAEHSRPLHVLGYLFLAGFIFLFYYSLHVDLAKKSWIIAGSGILMFVVRWAAGILASKPSPVPAPAP